MEYSLYFAAEIISLVTSVFFFNRIRGTHLQWFPLFLLIVVVYEYGVINNWFTINHSNLWMANIITIIELCFYAIYLRSIITDKQKRKSIIKGLIILLVLCVLNIAFLQGFWRLHTYTLLLTSVFIVFWICSFFRQLLSNDYSEIVILKYADFWIVTGIMFFYLGCFSFFSVFEYMAYKKDYAYLSLSFIILNFTNIILYAFISIGLICQKRTHPSS